MASTAYPSLKQAGITLIELTITMAILTVTLVIASNFYSFGLKTIKRNQMELDLQLAVRQASNAIAKDLQQAQGVALGNYSDANLPHPGASYPPWPSTVAAYSGVNLIIMNHYSKDVNGKILRRDPDQSTAAAYCYDKIIYWVEDNYPISGQRSLMRRVIIDPTAAGTDITPGPPGLTSECHTNAIKSTCTTASSTCAKDGIVLTNDAHLDNIRFLNRSGSVISPPFVDPSNDFRNSEAVEFTVRINRVEFGENLSASLTTLTSMRNKEPN